MGAHTDHGLKHATLCLLGRVQVGHEGTGRAGREYEMHEGAPACADAPRGAGGHPGAPTVGRPTPRPGAAVFEDVLEPARYSSRQLMGELMAYGNANGLFAQDSLAGIAAPDGAITDAELEACGGDKLSQVAFLPFMRTQYKEAVMGAQCGYGPFQYYENGARGMLMILTHFLQHEHYDAQTAQAVLGGSHRLAPCKTIGQYKPNGAASGFEMWFAIGSQHLCCRGSHPKHVANPDPVIKTFKPH